MASPSCECHDEDMIWQKDARMVAGGYFRCRTQLRESSTAWRKKNPERNAQNSRTWRAKNLSRAHKRQHDLVSRYGITVDDYEKILEEQKGACAICLEVSDGYLCVDHCHATGKVRGLLCHACNIGIARLGENPATILRAASYLSGDYGIPLL